MFSDDANVCDVCCIKYTNDSLLFISASEMTYIVSSGALNSTHSLITV